MMKILTVLMILLTPLVVLLGITLWFLGAYNGVIRLDQNVQQTTAQVQNEMQRQNDLIPNMVEVLKEFVKLDTDVFVKVAEARAKLTAVQKLDPTAIAGNSDLQKQVVDAQKTTGQALLAINTVSEAYPDLKANDQFNTLTTELEGSQNRITVARKYNQQAVQAYNQTVLSIPVKFFGFLPKPYFQANEEAQTAPKIKFN
jgi:LemA protein